MRTRNALTIATAVLALSGCGGGGGGSDRGMSVAPITSGSPGPITSNTNPGGTPGGNPNNGLLTDALVTSFQMDEVIHLDAATGQTSLRWATGNGPTDVATWGNDVYTANTLDQNVTVVDRLANTVVTNVDVKQPDIITLPLLNLLNPMLKPLVRPTGIAVTPNGTKAYSANLINLVAIDTNTNLPTKSVSGLNINFTQVLSSLLSGGGLSAGLQSLYQQPIEHLGIAKVAATNDIAVATCMLSGRLMRVSVATDDLLPAIDLRQAGGTNFPAPIGVAIARNKAYVACAVSQETVVVDLVTGMIRARIRGGMIPVDVAASPSEDKIYVANVVSGDVSVIDTAADIIVDTLPAGLNIGSIFTQLGVTIPTGTTGGISGLLNGFLQGFLGSLSNPNTIGGAIGGSGGLLSPGNLINGLLTGFLAYAGINQQMLNGLNLPAFGIWSVSVAHNPIYLCSANVLMGNVGVTQTQNRSVNTMMGLTGMGPADVSAVWKR